MADEDLVISIDGEDAEIRTGETEGATDAVADLKSQLATLEAQNKAERERVQAAERRASEEAQRANRATEEVKTARTEITDRELDTVVSGIAAAQAEADAAEKDFAAAAEAGDFKKQAEAQRKIARAEAKLSRLDEAKVDIEVRRADTGGDRSAHGRGREQTREAPQQRVTEADPIEAVLSQMRPETASWIRAHPEHGMALARDVAGRASAEDTRRANKLRAAHSDAIAEGYGQDTPEYFRHVENFVGITKKEATNGADRQQQQNGGGERTRRASPSVAPVSGTGSGAGGSGNGGTEVRLSAKEAEAAKDGTHVWNPGNKHPKTGEPIKRDDPLVGQPIGTREFAKRKLAMQREGHYDRVYLEQ